MGELRSLILPPYAVCDWTTYHSMHPETTPQDQNNDQVSMSSLKQLYHSISKKRSQYLSKYKKLSSLSTVPSSSKEESEVPPTLTKTKSTNNKEITQINTELSQTVKDLFHIVDTVPDKGDSKSTINEVRSALIKMSEELDLSISKYNQNPDHESNTCILISIGIIL